MPLLFRRPRQWLSPAATGGEAMPDRARLHPAATAAAFITFTLTLIAQPNPYSPVDNWAQLPAGRTMGSLSAVDVDPKGNIWVGGALRPEQLRGPIRSADPEVRSVGQTAQELRGRHVRVPARHPRRPRRQRLGHRRARAGRQGPSGLQVQPRRQAAADARQGRRAPATDPTRSISRPTSSSRRTATSSSPTATARNPTRAS